MNKIKAVFNDIWAVKYLPTKIEDLAASEDVLFMLQDCINNGIIPNHLCLYGPPGTGKNSIVNILKNNLDVHMLIINASEESGIDTIRGKVLAFANSGALFNKPKIIVMNEADGLSNQAQDSMKELMETKANQCRFIFTCNNVTQIISPLRSRFSLYKIDPPLREVVKRLAFILKNENVLYTKGFIVKFIKINGRDLRKLANEAQILSKMYPDLTENLFSSNTDTYTDFFDSLFLLKDLKEIGTKIKAQMFDEDIYSVLAEYCIEKRFKSESIVIISDHLAKSQTIYDKDIVFMSCFLSIKDLI